MNTLMTMVAGLALALTSGCAATVTSFDDGAGGGGSEVDPRANGLEDGLIFDHPEGLFREVMLTDRPVECESARYYGLEGTGWIHDDAVVEWLSLTENWSGHVSSMLHDGTSNTGPGTAELEIPTEFGVPPAEVGGTVVISWSLDFAGMGIHRGGVSTPRYCGVLSPEH